MRKGYSINEILLIVALLGLLMFLSVQPLRILLQEIPNFNEVMEQQTKLEGFFEVLQQDVQQAGSVYTFSADRRIGGDTLVLRGSGKQVYYKITSANVMRIATDSETGKTDSTKWDFPHIQIQWDVYEFEDKPAGVEITSWYQKKYMGKEEKKFHRSNLFFAGIERTRLNP